jgi:hypothetical protein
MLDTLHIVLLSIAIAQFLALAAIGTFYFKKKYDKRIVKEKQGVRYTVKDNTTDEAGNVNASFVKGDVMMQADEIYKVNKNGPIKPGRYNILSPQAGKKKINLKINGIRRSQAHNSGIVFAEGDVVVAEHESIILR